MIFGENALLLDFKYRRVEEKHRAFFYTTLDISVHVVDQIIEDKDSLILEFNNKKLRVKH